MPPRDPRSPANAPVVRGRFLATGVSHAVFFAVLASGWLDRAFVIPVYLLWTFGLWFGLNWLEWSRLSPFLQERYPAEFAKLITRSGHGYNSLRGLRFAFRRGPGDNPVLGSIRRHWRWMWIEVLLTPPLMFLLVVTAVTLSRHGGGA